MVEGEYGEGDQEAQIFGYVFSSYDNTAVETMGKIGYHDIGHIFHHGKDLQPEYCTGECGTHAVIVGRSFYVGGYMLKYRVVGVG